MDISWSAVVITLIAPAAALAGVWLNSRNQRAVERERREADRLDAEIEGLRDGLAAARLIRDELETARAAFREIADMGHVWDVGHEPPTVRWDDQRGVLARVTPGAAWNDLEIAYNRLETAIRIRGTPGFRPG